MRRCYKHIKDKIHVHYQFQTHIEHRAAGAVGREGLVHLIPVLTPQYLLPFKWVPGLAPSYLLPRRAE